MAETIDKELTVPDSKMIQGMAVVAMLCLHLFDRHDYQGLFSPLLFIGEYPLSFYVGQLSDFCVMGFAFCSGYAHMKLFGLNNGYYPKRLKSLLKLFIQYWIIIIAFSLVSIAMGEEERMPGSLRDVLGNLFVYHITYCGAWWYMYAYTLLVLLSPIFLRIIKQENSVIVLVSCFVVYCAAYYVRFNIQTTDLFLSKVGPFGMTLFEYVLGSVYCKEKLFSKEFFIWKRINRGGRIFFSCAIVVMLLLIRTLVFPSLFFAPASGIVLITLFHFWGKPQFIKKLFLLIGSHSTNIWLTHMFFYLYMFKNLVYMAKYPLCILGFMLAITIITSLSLQLVQKPAIKWIR